MSPVLRRIQAGDGEALHALFIEPGVRQYLFDDILLTREDSRKHVEVALTHDAWVIELDGSIVGFTSLRPIDEGRELMIAISERCWSRGVAFEAARAAMSYGFDVLKLDRILAGVDLPNERSHRLMARLGFISTGESDGPKYRARTYELSAAAWSTSSRRW